MNLQVRQIVHIILTLLVNISTITLGMELRGEIIRGLPCIKRLNQLFCPNAGSTYPGTSINKFLDDNKALMRRMYGELQQATTFTRTTVRVVRTFNGARYARNSKLQYYNNSGLTDVYKFNFDVCRTHNGWEKVE
jgi:hypothetical protein